MNKLKNLSIILCLFALATITSCSSSSTNPAPVVAAKVTLTTVLGTAKATTTGEIALDPNVPAKQTLTVKLMEGTSLLSKATYVVKKGGDEFATGDMGITYATTGGILNFAVGSATNTKPLTLTIKGTSVDGTTVKTIDARTVTVAAKTTTASAQ